MVVKSESLITGAATLLCAWVCAAAQPIGTEGDRVHSFFRGEPLKVAALARVRRESVQASDDGQRYHVVQPGETLWRISRRFNTTVDTISGLNGLSDPTALSVGMRLRLPASAVDSGPESVAPAQPGVGSGLKKTADALPRGKPAVGSQRRGKSKLQWPVDGKITSRFGRRWGRAHDGIDVGAPRGTSVRAAEAGEVLFSGGHGSYGNLVVIKHSGRLVTVYAHNKINLVRKGQRVRRGQRIAQVGQTGRASGPHLHLEVRVGTTHKNPLSFLSP